MRIKVFGFGMLDVHVLNEERALLLDVGHIETVSCGLGAEGAGFVGVEDGEGFLFAGGVGGHLVCWCSRLLVLCGEDGMGCQ